MKRFSSAVCMAALLLVAGTAADVNFSSAIAQDVQVDFNTFHDQLAPYGDWVYSDRWGEVWIPTDVPDDFHPYGTNGHWVDTDDYGWTWVSDYEWGDIPFHYGRWVNDPDDGWLWIPGYVWSPAWVVWRHNGQYTGWMPMPPDQQFLGYAPPQQPGVSVGINIGGLNISFGESGDDYGYSRWYGSDYGQDRYAQNWVFVGTGHIADPDFRRYEAPRNNYGTIIRNTTNITNYTVVNNYIVNRSVDPRAVQQAGGHVQPVKLATVMKKPQFVTKADAGVQIQERARADRPHGTGFADSAPKPTATVVQSLSTKAPPSHGGHAHMHLFTRDTVAKAPLPAAPAKTEKAPTNPQGEMKAMPGMAKTPEPGTEHEKGSSMSGPAMNGPATAVPKNEKHDHTMAPAMSGPGMSGPAAPGSAAPATAVEPKHGKHERMTTPGMSGPAAPGAAAPTTTTTEAKHEKHDHMMAPATSGSGMSGPGMSGPSMSGPAAEPKHEKPTHEMANPSMSGPAMTAPAATPAEPKRENHMRAPATANAHATPPAGPKPENEPHKKPKKPDDSHPQ